jgi:ubiquinone biosynthesis protein
MHWTAKWLVGDPATFARRLVELGPTFIKLGQFLASRPDILPEDYCLELMRLLDRVPPFPWPQARQILVDELEAQPEFYFSWIEPEPFAAASLAQVHAARLLDGTEVAVKIQRPLLEERVARDLKRARRFARLWELSASPFLISPTLVVDELSKWMMQEIDFRNELANLAKMSDLVTGSTFERVPRPYAALSTRRVLTAELLKGIPVSEVLLRMRPEEARFDRNRFAHNLVYSTLRQIFRLEFFHADLHPGNLLVMPGDAVGFVDFGLCDELDESVRQQQFRYLFAVYSRDVNRMYQALTEILIPGPQTDMEQFRRDFMAQSHIWLGATRARRSRQSGAPFSDRSPIADAMISVMRLARKHSFQIPARILSMYRALLAAETVAHQMSATADLRSVGRAFFREVQFEAVLGELSPSSFQSFALNLLDFVRDAPDQLHHILSEVAEGRFVFKVSTTESAEARKLRNRRTRLVTAAILSIGLTILLMAPGALTIASLSLRPVVGAALIMLYAWIVVEWLRLN